MLGRYDDSRKESPPYQEDDDYDRPRGIGASASVPMKLDMTGDEAYQRRLAMSKGLAPAVSEAPKLSPGVPPPSFQPPTSLIAGDEELNASGVAHPRAETGEEAYLRRLAMSQGRQPDPTPAFPPPAPAPVVAPEPPTLAYNPFAPPSAVPPPPSAIPPSVTDDRVRSSREAAAAIAAKLAALAPPEGSEEAAPDSEVAPVPAQEEPAPPKR